MQLRMFLCLLSMLSLLTVSAQAYRLQFKDTAGTVRSYRLNMTTTGAVTALGTSMPMNSTMTATATEKVLAMQNGLASISYEMKDGKMVATVTGVPGEDTPQTVEQPIPDFGMTYNRSPLGRVTNVKFTGSFAQMLSGQGSTVQYPGEGMEFPNRELNAGDTWQGTQQLELGAGSRIQVKVKYTLVGTRQVAGRTLLEIKSDYTGTSANMTLRVPSSMTMGMDIGAMKMSMTINGQDTTLFDEASGQMIETALLSQVIATVSAGDEEGAIVINMMMNGKFERVK